MSYVALIAAAAGGGGTFYAIRKTPIPIAGKIGISLVGAGLSYYAGSKLNGLINPGPGKEQVQLASTEAQQILKNNAVLPADQRITASYTPQQMLTYANKLETAMEGLGTTNDSVKEVFNAMNNDLDILLLIEAFGVRDDDDLATWLEDDGATDYVNAILDTKSKISKRF